MVERGRFGATCRTISASGKYVAPSPYERHRPTTNLASSPSERRELRDEAALADARLAEDGQDAAPVLGSCLIEGVSGAGRARPRDRRECGVTKRPEPSGLREKETSLWAATRPSEPPSSTGSTGSVAAASCTRLCVVGRAGSPPAGPLRGDALRC